MRYLERKYYGMIFDNILVNKPFKIMKLKFINLKLLIIVFVLILNTFLTDANVCLKYLP